MSANQKSLTFYQQITKYQLMMSAKQDPKLKKQKKGKETKPSEQPITVNLPQKVQVDNLKTPFLRDLSPFSPIYHTVKKSYDLALPHSDLAIIETPLNLYKPKSLIQEVESRYNKISKLLVWEEQEQQANNSGSCQLSGSSSSMSNDQNCQQNRNQDNSAIKISDMQGRVQSQIIQKAGQKIKNPKILKKIKERGIKIEASETKRKVTCNCKKTKCLKLYCDCFHENQVCGPQCNCVGCHNTDEHQQERYNSMLSLMQRNPQAFRPRLEQEQHAKGCNCKKSGCLKKYCECYQAGLGCGEHCKCEDCKNSKNIKQGAGREEENDEQKQMEMQQREQKQVNSG